MPLLPELEDFLQTPPPAMSAERPMNGEFRPAYGFARKRGVAVAGRDGDGSVRLVGARTGRCGRGAGSSPQP
jgi:hypothetical protein